MPRDPNDVVDIDAATVQTDLATADTFGEVTTDVHARNEAVAEQQVEPGTHIGRYVVGGRIGAGGMAVVYEAFDPKLHRHIALKLVKARGGGEQAQQRLLREAQAMAKLAHPNVIAVHDVGTWGEQVFLTMELVDGETLREWMKRKHSRESIIEMFTQAGRGLAAAHAKGLVHRDFKPDNALVGRDGRLRVLDLGLAQPTNELVDQESKSSASNEGIGAENQLAHTLTRTGSVLGTPIYMAPEQHLAQPTDARSDQFAFAVALYEALYDERPFEADTLVDLIEAVSHGKVLEEPANSQVPPWLRIVLLRALSPDPDQRYPRMDDMLTAISRDPKARTRRILGIVGILAVVQVALLGIFLGVTRDGEEKPELCPSAAKKLAGAWDTAIRERVRAAFVASKRPHAAASFRRVAAHLNAYTKAWLEMERQACEATRVHAKQSHTVWETRVYCLDRRADEIRGLTTLLSTPDEKIVDKSIKLTRSLTDLHTCADKISLALNAPLPTDPQKRLAVAELDAKLQVALALRDSGSIKQARDRLRLLAADADRIGYGPLQARVLRQLAFQEHRLDRGDVARQVLRHAATIAAKSRDTVTVAALWADLTRAATRDDRMKEAESMLWYAETALHLAGKPPESATKLWLIKADLLADQARYDEARHSVEKAIASITERHGPKSTKLSSALNTLGQVLSSQGKYKEARAAYERGLAIDIEIYGDPHPALIALLANLGSLMNTLGDDKAATDLYQRAYDTHVKSIGPEPHGHLVAIHQNLAVIHRNYERLDIAMTHAKKALAMRESMSGKDDAGLTGILTGMAQILRAQGKHAEALPHIFRALDIRERKLGKNHIKLTTTLQNVSDALGDLKRFTEARKYLLRAIEIYKKTGTDKNVDAAYPLVSLGSLDSEAKNWKSSLASYQKAEKLFAKGLPHDHTHIAVTLYGQGDALIGLGRSAEAIPILQRAVRIRVKRKSSPGSLGASEVLLGKALWLSNVDRTKAKELLLAARAKFVSVGKKRAESLAELDKWMRRNRVR